MTAQPHAHVRFRRAIERRALWLAEDVTPEETYLEFSDHVLRCENGPKMREALDAYLLTGEPPAEGVYTLLPPGRGVEVALAPKDET